MEKKLLRKIVTSFVVTGLVFMILFSTLLYYHERKALTGQMDRSLDQIESFYKDSEKKIWEKRSKYATDYLYRIREADYVLHQNEGKDIRERVLELRDLINVADIYLLDASGEIRICTNEALEGKRLLENDGSKAFYDLLKADSAEDPVLVFHAEEIIEGMDTQDYVGLKSDLEGYPVLMMGINKNVLTEMEDEASVGSYLSDAPTDEKTDFFVVDATTGEILGATRKKAYLLSTIKRKEGQDMLSMINSALQGKVLRVGSRYKLVKTRKLDDAILVCISSENSYFTQVFQQVLAGFLLLCCTFISLTVLIRSYFREYIFKEFEMIETTIGGILSGKEGSQFHTENNTEMKKLVELLNNWNINQASSRANLTSELADAVQASEKDSLTELINRFGFEKYVKDFCAQENAHGVMLMMDVDNFKTVNDILGHPEGDKLLRLIADTLKTEFRADDLIARLGGDEFAVFLKANIVLEELEAKLERVLDTLRKRMEEYYDKYNVSVSVGAAFTETNEGYEALYRSADTALYKAKQSGKNRYVVEEKL